MNLNGTFATALARGAYSAVLTGLLAFLTALQQGGDDRKAVIIGSIAGLTVLATRGGLEGLYDSARQTDGSVKPSDVQPDGKGVA